MRYTPSAFNVRWMPPSTFSGFAWSWIASNVVTKSNSCDVFRAGPRQLAHDVEQPGAVADRNHQAQRTVVQRRQHLAREGFRLRRVERLLHGHAVSCL
jgi:hypothetical protein